MRLLRAGRSYKEAAYEMQISVGTFHTYVVRAYRKLGVQSRYELVSTRLRTPDPRN